MPKIYDNINISLEEGLNRTLNKAKRADFCIGYFNLRGWQKIADKIEHLEGDYLPEEYDDDEKYHCRLLIGMQKMPKDELKAFFAEEKRMDNKTASELKKKIVEEFKEQLIIGHPTNADEIALKKLAKQLVSGKVIVKLHLRHTLHAKLYLTYREDYNTPVIGFVGSSNLTFSGISKQGELNVDVVDGDAANKLSHWFQDRWEDRYSLDISKELATVIKESWASERLNLPYHIYLKMAYHLSHEARAGISQYQLPKIFQNKLLDYQENAVKIAANHLHKRNGVIIGDVVGLGKTITATALAKIFEDDFGLETLIICPKNLIEMWKDYAHQYQLRAKILSITKVIKELAKTRRYRLVLIDESHNLRNKTGKRYKVIQEYLDRNDSKVIMLTATPYNKTYKDLSNQLRLFLNEEHNLGISPENFIRQLGSLTQFKTRYQIHENTIAAFEKSEYADDWAELMRLFLVRRTRSFVKNNYALEDKEKKRRYLLFPNGGRSYFPDRIPKSVQYEFDLNDPNDQYAKLYSEEVVEIIEELSLPRYGLGKEEYENIRSRLKSNKIEEQIKKNLSRAGARLIGITRTSVFKRLESSGYAFLLTISRHIMRNYLFIYAINNKLSFPIGKQESGLIDDFLYTDNSDEDEANPIELSLLLKEADYLKQAEAYYNALKEKEKRFRWIRSQLFNSELKKDLVSDSKLLLSILKKGKNWKQENDRQLNALYDLITYRHRNEKILIFTQYAHTAQYLYNSLKMRGVKKVEFVTGNDESPTAKAHRFSPKSNHKDIPKEEEIQILITTDVLSEGQNLQDAHVVLNYDLPWAIIRLIQRAGRIDRIGQKHHEIFCYSFLPEDGIEQIINLRGRLKQRLKQNAETVGSDEIFFEGDPINIIDLYNEKAGILDENDTDEDIDLASFAFQIWKNAIEKDKRLEKVIPKLPNVAFATRAAQAEHNNNSAIVYTKTIEGNDVLMWIDENEDVITQSQTEILKTARCHPNEKALSKTECHHELVKTALYNISDVNAQIGGGLRGSRKRTYERLEKYLKKDSIFANTQKVKKAIQDIYQYPLTASAKAILGRHLKSGIKDEDLANLVLSLKENDDLVLKIKKQKKQQQTEIICSLGFKK